MQLVVGFCFCTVRSYTRCKYFLLKEDSIQWLTKAAAAIIISSLQGAVLVTEFYDIMTSAASAASFPLKLQSVTLCTLKPRRNREVRLF